MDPSHALAEVIRILRPNGRLLLLDLRAHDEAWVREKLGDQWLGFSEDQLRRLLMHAGFDNIRIAPGARRTNDPFVVLVGVATKACDEDRSKKKEARKRLQR